MVPEKAGWRGCEKCGKSYYWGGPGAHCGRCNEGNPVTAEIAAREPEGTPAPPRPGTVRMKVGCVYCCDIFSDDVVPGKPYACRDCFIKRRGVVARSLQVGAPVPPEVDQYIRVTKLEADDVLVLRLPRDATAATIEAITAKLAASKIRCLVINPDIDVEVLRPSPSSKETANAE